MVINVTQTYLPSFEKYCATLKRAWDNKWITNNGELVQELESRLKQYLGVKHLFFCNNGTIVLQMAIKALGVSREVITTPFSYVATTNAILWENCKPVFVDIEPHSYCIDASKIEAAITPDTEAILATHVYGLPCNVQLIEEIAQRNGLKVIYDGAHAFGCILNGKSLLSYGDVSTCSFHATKLFHSVEGGCITTNDDELARRLMLYRQFGHIGDDYYSIGINGKASEFHAAMGLCVLDDIDQIIAARRVVSLRYHTLLAGSTRDLGFLNPIAGDYNYGYYPVFFSSEAQLLNKVEQLRKRDIMPRRYFYPSLNTLPFLKHNFKCPVAEDISKRVLCLPLYVELSEKQQDLICDILKSQ